VTGVQTCALPISAHIAFQSVLKPHMDKVFVVDYFVEPNN
jgi:hypothetical protein